MLGMLGGGDSEQRSTRAHISHRWAHLLGLGRVESSVRRDWFSLRLAGGKSWETLGNGAMVRGTGKGV